MNSKDLELNDLIELQEPSNSAATYGERNSAFGKLQEEERERSYKIQKSLDETANNSQEAKEQLKEINALQKEQLENLRQQLANDEKIIKLLNDLLSCETKSELDNNELLNIIKGQVDAKHPLSCYIADKGGDAFVSVFLVPILKSIKIFLATKMMF